MIPHTGLRCAVSVLIRAALGVCTFSCASRGLTQSEACRKLLSTLYHSLSSFSRATVAGPRYFSISRPNRSNSLSERQFCCMYNQLAGIRTASIR